MPIVVVPASMVKKPASVGVAVGSSKRPRLRTLEETVSQCIRDNFKNWKPELVDVKRVAGRTLREVLTEDRKVGNTMGSTYYAALTRQFRDETDAYELLRPARQGEQFAPGLLKGMIAFKKEHPDKAVLQLYLRSAEVGPNETELCGIGRYLLTAKPGCRL